MKLNTKIPFLQERLNCAEKEFEYLKNKYSNIAFNAVNWNGSYNKGKYLFSTEGYITIPKNYDLNFLKKNYKGIITTNSKIKKSYEPDIEVHLVDGVGNFNDFWLTEEEDFINFKNKIHGICAINNIYKANQSDGDIVKLRESIFNSINIKNFVKHVYSRAPWGGENYKGHPHNTPSSPENLKVLSKYKFCMCFESMYHEIWSYDWITERIFNCFKVKTLPIYWGCYNIEKKIPEETYIDLRKFKDINEAILSVVDIDEQEYNKKTNLGYQFYNDTKIGNILEIEKTLEELNK